MIEEHHRVVLSHDLPAHRLIAGDVGTVVHIYPDRAAYEIEFFTLAGTTLDVVTVSAEHVRPVAPRDVLHVRQLS